MSTSITTTKSTERLREDKSNRYQSLVQKKAALEKRLNEKYEQLHQLCQKEADLIGNNLDLITPSGSNLSTTTTQQHQLMQIQQRNKIHQNEINKLLIEKQKQQQLSQNSLSIVNDPMQSKSLRRTHKQAYEMSQQKIEKLNENINLLAQKRYDPMTKAQDDIALHRNDNRYVKNALAMVGNNAKNLHMLNANNNIAMSERRNSMKSTTSSLGSSNTFIVQSSPSSATSLTSLKTLPNNIMNHSPRTRADSNGFNQHRYEFEIQKNDSPTPSTMSLQHPQMHININHQIPLCSQSLKNIKINTENHSPNISQSYHPHGSQYSPQISQQQQFFVPNQMMYQQQAQPQIKPSQHPPISSRQQTQANDHAKFIHRLHSFNYQMQHDKNYNMHMASTNTINHITDDIRMKHMAKQQQQQQASPNHHFTVSHSAGLGGYWTMNEHNQRVWVSDVKYPLSPPNQTHSMAKKSNSLGNFDFMHKHEEESNQQPQPDAVSVSSANSNELKKKEKIWCETSLDSPPETRKFKLRIESPTDYLNNNHVMNQAYDNTPPSSRIHPIPPPNRQHHQQQQTLQQRAENGNFQNPLANLNNNTSNPNTNCNAPKLPPKSKLRYSESTRSTMSNRDLENNIVNSMISPVQQQQLHSPQVQVESSPLNVTIIQEGSWKPYKEEIKSYEISDFYKYSEKYRQQQQQQQQQQRSNIN